ncbi:MAG: cobyrinate a,c-diamide synthase [Pseudomonadota bacterium]
MPNCSALLIAAPASGQGKTTVTAALARLYSRQGRRVRVFKCGPDFLDPQVLAVASGAPVYNLDLAMCGELDVAIRLASAAAEADLILLEGVMGLFDGTPSAADLACRFGIPILGLINASAMAQTFGAVAYGLAHYRPGLPFSGVLANQVGSAYHAELLRASLPPGMRWYGALAHDSAVAMPERHLGLLPAAEMGDLDKRLELLADALEQALVDSTWLPPAIEFTAPAASAPDLLLAGQCIAVARDLAFNFIYPANLDTLQALGARLSFFSPLAGDALPECDAVWLPGGYPELHAATLAARQDLWAALSRHVAAGKALLAECGGMMVLFEQLLDRAAVAHTMAALLPGRTIMQARLLALGVQFVALPEGLLSGHTFHYSKCETELAPLQHAYQQNAAPGEAVYRRQRLTASYVHFYFASNPAATAALFLP